jgi:hypothetical protein
MMAKETGREAARGSEVVLARRQLVVDPARAQGAEMNSAREMESAEVDREVEVAEELLLRRVA